MADTAEFQKLRTLKETYAAKLAKKNFEAKEKLLMNVAELDARQFSRERCLAGKILSIPDKIAHTLAKESDQRSSEEIIEYAIRHAIIDDTSQMP